MKQEKDQSRLIGTLFLGLALLLGAVFLGLAWVAVSSFDAAWHAQELCNMLSSTIEPGAGKAMFTRDLRLHSVLLGARYLIVGLFTLAVGIFAAHQGWKRRREGKT